jgi:hypothetical protein
MAGAKRKPERLDAAVVFAGGSTMMVDSKRRNRIETRLRAVEQFVDQYLDILPKPMGAIVADCARAGIRPGQGQSGTFLSQTDKHARETALKEVPELLRQYRAQARAEGRPRSWARLEVAQAVHQRMHELGVKNPPSVESLLKSGFAL